MMEQGFNWEYVHEVAARNQEHFNQTGDTEGLDIRFEYQGVCIINPFRSECSRFEVDPVAYYGEAFLQSPFVKPKQ